MKLEGQHHFMAARADVWEMLNDPDVLARAIPGCKRLVPVGEDQYEMTIELGVAAIKGTYHGQTEILDKRTLDSYTLHIAAEGPTGTVDATAHIRLEDTGDGTLAVYSGEAQIGGLVAGVGQRILSGVAKMVVGQFFKTMGQLLKEAV